MSTSSYRICPLCEAACGLRIETEGAQVIRIRGAEDDPFSQGYICPKAIALKDLHEDPDRAPSDGPVMVPLAALGGLIDQVLAIHAALIGAPVVDLGTPGAP